MYYIIGVLDKDKKPKGYLYKTHTNVNKYLISDHASCKFATQDAALNFIYFCSDYISKDNLSEGDTFVIIPSDKDDRLKVIFKEDDKND